MNVRWYTIVQSFLGPIHVGINHEGAVSFLELTPDWIKANKYCSYEFAKLPQKMRSKIHRLCRFITTPETDISGIEFDIQGSDLDKKVWQHLQSIPVGETRSYSEVASAVGIHHRAVAKICGRNCHAIIIPCHRVIMKSGQLGGYRWGTKLKRNILSYEGIEL